MLGLQYDDHTSNVKLKQLYSNKKQFEKTKRNKPHTCQQSLYTSTDLDSHKSTLCLYWFAYSAHLLKVESFNEIIRAIAKSGLHGRVRRH